MLAGPAAAHPHVFVDVSFELIFDEAGRLSQIRTRWFYDELYSLLIIEDRGADTDGDGELSSDELAPLQGFDSDWGEGSDGDLHVIQAGPVALGSASDWVAFWQDGRLGSYHSRALEAPLDMGQGGVFLKPYDRTYYIAYHIVEPITFTGREGCRAQVLSPDLDAAQKALQARLAALPRDASPEQAGFPDVGAEFSETLWIACAR